MKRFAANARHRRHDARAAGTITLRLYANPYGVAWGARLPAYLTAESMDIEPQSYLMFIRNVRPGLKARTRIITSLRKRAMPARELVAETGLSYRSVLSHLNAMRRGRVVRKEGRRPYSWSLTGYGQQAVLNYV